MRAAKMLFPVDALENMRTVYEILVHTKQNSAEKTAYRQIEKDGEESSLSFSACTDRVDCLRAGLMQTGFGGRHIALLGETSVEWLCTYFAVVSGVGVCVPLDKEQSEVSLAAQLNKADTEAVFVSEKCLSKLLRVISLCPGIRRLVVMRDEYEGAAPEGCAVTSFSALLEEGRVALEQRGRSILPEKIDPDAPCLIIFTSGTTGANKGVVLSNRNILGSLRGCDRLLRIPEVSFSVLPIHHSYELHTNILFCYYRGTCVCINDELRYIMKNLKRFRPGVTCMVPMMLDTIVRQMKRELKRSGRQEAFERMRKLSDGLRKLGIDLRRTFFREILDSLGGNLRMIVCGGARLDQEAADFLSAVGIDVYNGYGITECSPVVAVNSVKLNKRGSVGRVLPTDEVRIADPDGNGNGEIQLRGDNIMSGYYKADADTAQVFTADGWFKTGDIGCIDNDLYLYINGRIKNLIILPNGKNIFPEEIEENLMKQIPYIRECVVTENDSMTGLYGYIYPDPDFCGAKGLTDADAIRDYLQRDIDVFNRSEPGYKRLIGFEIRSREFEKNTAQKILRYKVTSSR